MERPMSHDTGTIPGPADPSTLRSPVREFWSYCQKERDHRLNSDQNFDSTLFLDAVRLVLLKLGIDEEEMSS